MVHQAEEERQVAGSNALLVQRQNEGAAVGFEKEVAVLDALGDALARDDRSDVVLGDERFEFLVGNFRIDGHGERQATRTRGSLNSTLSRVTVTRSEEHTSELQSLMRISYAGFCLKKKN